MPLPLRGRVHGAFIELDAPLPQLEGRRVLVLVEPEEPELGAGELRDAWEQWAECGAQGPVEDEQESEFP